MNLIIFKLLLITGMRDRLRCPSCKAVGTYKPHTPCPDGSGGRRPWRWMCKWCGYYRGPEGSGRLVYPSELRRYWWFKNDPGSDSLIATPQEVVNKTYGYPVWPWRG